MICPHCNLGIAPEELESFKSMENSIFYAFYECPNCHKGILTKELRIRAEETILEIYPYSGYCNCPDNIVSFSPDFVEIYNQALTAHNAGLKSISGIGFRKAFEFLIKDYAIFKNPNDKEVIIKNSLSKVIQQYFQNDTLNSVFKKITWLANDHTHYYNKHTEYNVDDLIRFIKASITIIDSQMQLKELDKIQPA